MTMNDDIYQPLDKQEVIKAVERRCPTRRIPMIMAKWWGEGLEEQYGSELSRFDKYPEDAVMLWIDPLDIEKMDLSWLKDAPAPTSQALDASGIITDWKYLDEFIEKMPSPNAPGLFDHLHEAAREAHAQNRYLVFSFWRLFFERPWELRGMANLMIDFYENPNEVHRLNEALCNLYVGLINRAARELKPDGFFTSDDLGNQRQLMMKPDHFRQFLKPYYRRVGQVCRENGMHFWLHSCGNNTEVMEDLIEVGVNVFHPVQKHTMDEKTIAEKFGDRLSFLAGFDVQQTLMRATADQVRQEVRFLIDTFDRPDGGMCIAAGNGIVAGTPIENIEAFLSESLHYGYQHRQSANQ